MRIVIMVTGFYMSYTKAQPKHPLSQSYPEEASFEDLLAALINEPAIHKDKSSAKQLANLARTPKGLMYLTPETIASIVGIGPSRTATLIAAIELGRRQHGNDWPVAQKVNLKQIACHLQSQLEGMPNEYFYLYSFNRSLGFIREHILAHGGAESVDVHMRDILRNLLNDRASKALIAHNHPDESAVASQEDLQSMYNLQNLLDEINIKLLDQFIIGIDGVYSCLHEKYIIYKNKQSQIA